MTAARPAPRGEQSAQRATTTSTTAAATAACWKARALHYLLTRDNAWLGRAEPVLAKACQLDPPAARAAQSSDSRPTAGAMVMEPPADVCDCADARRQTFSLNAWHYAGLQAGPPRSPAEREPGTNVRHGLLAEVDVLPPRPPHGHRPRHGPFAGRSEWPTARTAASVPLRALPARAGQRPGHRVTWATRPPAVRTGRWFEAIMGDAAPGPQPASTTSTSPWSRNCSTYMRTGSSATGRTARTATTTPRPCTCMLDDVPLFLRGMYNSYAAEVDPDLGYIFWEVQKAAVRPRQDFRGSGASSNASARCW